MSVLFQKQLYVLRCTQRKIYMENILTEEELGFGKYSSFKKDVPKRQWSQKRNINTTVHLLTASVAASYKLQTSLTPA